MNDESNIKKLTASNIKKIKALLDKGKPNMNKVKEMRTLLESANEAELLLLACEFAKLGKRREKKLFDDFCWSLLDYRAAKFPEMTKRKQLLASLLTQGA